MTRREEVLRWVNRQRKEFGKRPLKKLPKGRKAAAFACPLANALPGPKGRVGVDCDTWSVVGEDWYRPVPKHVGEFVIAFDNGRYPELVEKS